jgi:F0F1-type ATP synthase gamma subunit
MVAEIPPPAEGGDNKDLKFLLVPITSDRGLCGGVNG